MTARVNTTANAQPANPPTGIGSRMLNIFVTPGEVFDEVIAMPFRQSTWLVPMLLVCLTGFFLVAVGTNQNQIDSMVRDSVESGRLPTGQAQAITRHWVPVSLVAICAIAATGTFWSATMVWAIGRFLLKSRFPFSRALAVVALTGTILALGSIVTGLLVLASGNGAMRPALTVFLPRLSPESTVVTAIGVFNLFHVWSVIVLGIGLARLAQVTLKEALFWVLGWWLVLRLGLLLLA